MAERTARIRGTSRELDSIARDLRRSKTRAEQVLWEALRARRLGGLKFRSQHPLGRVIVDFCCPEARLIVEVDGDVHDCQRERDEARQQHLEASGYRVLRFRNEHVLHALPGVLTQILSEAEQRIR